MPFRREWVAGVSAALVMLCGLMPCPAQQDEAVKRVEVVVDARELLITTLVWLATDGEFYGGKVDRSYTGATEKYFRAHKNHAAVGLVRRLTRQGFSYDAPVGWILHYGEPPELPERVALSPYHIRRAGSREALDRLAQMLRDFWRDSDFAAFIEQQQEVHRGYVDRVRRVLEAEGAVKRLEEFFGESRDSYTLLIAPPVGPDSFGASVDEGSLRHLFQVFSPTPYPDEASLQGAVDELVYHEFSHSFVNPLVEASAPRLNACASLYEPIRNQMQQQAYTDWLICVKEHFVRAATVRLIGMERGAQAAGQQLASDLVRGFLYLPPLDEALRTFEQQRETYPRFADFAPCLIEQLEKLAAEGCEAYLAQLPFWGNINMAVTVPEFSSSGVIVFPTGVEDSGLAEQTERFVRLIAGRFFPKARVASDQEALELALGEHVFVVYGTPATNAFLARHASELPFRVEEDAITVEQQRAAGPNLRLIAAVRNPANPRLPMVLYTSNDARLIPNINNVFHGPTGYVVANPRGKAVLQGFFPYPCEGE